MRGGDAIVEVRGARPRPVAELVGAAARARGWIVVAGPGSARWADLVEVGTALGVLAMAGDLAILDEALFVRLQHDPEHRAGGEGLARLRAVLADAAAPAAG